MEKTLDTILYTIGIAFIFIGISVSITYSIDWHSLNHSMSWGAILVSIGIAFVAGGIQRKSEMTTKTIAHSSLLETVGEFEDRRLSIRERFEKIQKKTRIIKNYSKNSTELQLDILDYTIYYSYSIWKCKTYLDRAMIFKKYFSENDENRLIHHIDCLFQDLCLGKQHFSISLTNENIRHLESMHNALLQLELFNLDEINQQDRKHRIETNLNYLKGLSEFWLDFENEPHQ